MAGGELDQIPFLLGHVSIQATERRVSWHDARQARDEADRKLRMDCPYCSLEASDQKVVFTDDLVWFVRDRRYQGALKHSGVIIPIAHRETVFDLTESEVAATFRLLRKVKAWMDADFSPDGYNVGWNCGRVGGQDVFHAHLHVIPRFRQEPLAGQGIRSHLKSEANRW